MNRLLMQRLCLILALAQMQIQIPACAQQPKRMLASGRAPGEKGANVLLVPAQILRSGVDLSSNKISPNSLQLSNSIGLTPLLEKIQKLRKDPPSIDYLDTKQNASLVIQKTNQEIEFVIAEINAEVQIYDEILENLTDDRDKLLARINAASFISNGILWAAAEAFSIPSFNTNFALNPRKVVQWPIPSGTTGIVAGVVPSLASMYTLKAVNGKRLTSEKDPNMLAKIFGYPTSLETQYPNSVWTFLNQAPADTPNAKKRMDQLIDRWIADANIPQFTDREARRQLDIVTASVEEKKGLSIASLSTRKTMLLQLSAEVLKMKKMLLELTMVLIGDKEI